MCVGQENLPRKSREISVHDLYGAPTKNVNNSTNIDPFDLI